MSLSRNTGYNLAGALVPMVLALATVPAYLKVIGVERFGVLSLAWVMLGYFGVFDLGLSRATAHRVATLTDDDGSEAAGTLGTALATNAVVGIAGALLLWGIGLWYFGTQLGASQQVKAEMRQGLPLLALTVPAATLTGVLLGALQGKERFREINLVSMASTALLQLLPLTVALLWSPSMSALLSSALLSRVLTAGLLWGRCKGLVTRGQPLRFEKAMLRPLLSYGGWVAATALASPFLVIADRFLIGALVGAVAITVYTVPFQLAQRLSVISGSLGGALFPRLTSAVASERDSLEHKALRSLNCVLLIPTLLGLYLMDPFLTLWVGHGIAAQAAPVGKALLIGYWFNSFAVIPYVRLQASGRPDLVLKILLVQVPFYLALLTLATYRYGLIGSAVVFALRCAVDYLLLARVGRSRAPLEPTLMAAFALLTAGAMLSSFWHLPGATGFYMLAATSAVAAAMTFYGAPPELVRLLRVAWSRRPGAMEPEGC